MLRILVLSLTTTHNKANNMMYVPAGILRVWCLQARRCSTSCRWESRLALRLRVLRVQAASCDLPCGLLYPLA
jgi:hypothetical protein